MLVRKMLMMMIMRMIMRMIMMITRIIMIMRMIKIMRIIMSKIWRMIMTGLLTFHEKKLEIVRHQWVIARHCAARYVYYAANYVVFH